MEGSHRIVCPCCATKLTVDAATGEILSEERVKPDHDTSFEEAMKNVRSGSQRREEAFSKAFQRTKNLDDLLGKKFEEAKKKASEDDKPWRNPLDND
jgi:phage-related tail protein